MVPTQRKFGFRRFFGKGSIKYKNGFKHKQFKLYPAFPNRFNPTTTIKYSLHAASHVTLKVYDLLGREVVGLVNEFKALGDCQAEFDTSGLASGFYVYQ